MTWRLLEKALKINVSKKKNLIWSKNTSWNLNCTGFSTATLKLSYCCTGNLEIAIKRQKCEEFKSCNCRGKITCPLNGVCCTEDMIYKAKVEDESGPNRVYIGCTEGTFKKQWYNHRSSFRLQSHMYCTKLPQPLMGVEGKKITEAQTKWSI